MTGGTSRPYTYLQQQRAQSEQRLAAAITQMSQSIRGGASNAHQANALVGEVQVSASGQQALATTGASVDRLHQGSWTSQGVLGPPDPGTARRSTALEVIGQIADQTNPSPQCGHRGGTGR